MTILNFVVNPCPSMPATNPPGLNLNVACLSHINLTNFVAIAFPVTISGPTDPSSAFSLSALVASSPSGSQYEKLCNCLRLGPSVQITLQCSNVAGFLVVQQVFCDLVQAAVPGQALSEIRDATQRIETAVSVTVINDLNQLKAQMAQVLARLPPTAGTSIGGTRLPISDFSQDGEDPAEDSERRLLTIEEEAS